MCWLLGGDKEDWSGILHSINKVGVVSSPSSGLCLSLEIEPTSTLASVLKAPMVQAMLPARRPSGIIPRGILVVVVLSFGCELRFLLCDLTYFCILPQQPEHPKHEAVESVLYACKRVVAGGRLTRVFFFSVQLRVLSYIHLILSPLVEVSTDNTGVVESCTT